MANSQSTQMRMRADRKEKLEQLAIQISSKVGKTVTWTDVTFYMVDNCTDKLVDDMVRSFTKKGG